MPRLWLTLLFLATTTACSDDGSPADDAGDTMDAADATPDETAAEAEAEVEAEAEAEASPSWEGVGIQWAIAPDRFSVDVTFTRDPGSALADVPGIYRIEGTGGVLTVESMTYDPATATAHLTTAKQKLGVEHTVFVTDAAIPTGELSADFVSADTAMLWTVDLMTYEQREVLTNRVALGDQCVVYMEDGYDFPIPPAWITYFDTTVYDTEATLFGTPPDIDGNGKVVFFVVSGEGFGGYFNPADFLSDEEAMSSWGIHSNEMEMIYINVEIAGAGIDEWRAVVPHEYAHLLYEAEHPSTGWEDWSYHNEGLAECATRAVNGGNDYALAAYFYDSSGVIARGLSLVNWSYSLYENYAVAYFFWSYIAAQLGGVPHYSELFHLPSGAPDDVDAFLQTQLGFGFGEIQMRGQLALWVNDGSGTYSYGDVVDLSGMSRPPSVPSPGASTLALEPFTGTFVIPGVATIDYPGTQGPDIVFAGINGTDVVDREAPFDVDGGALFVYNQQFEFHRFDTQSPGLPLPPRRPAPVAAGSSARSFSPAWADPPPLPPVAGRRFDEWRSMMVRIGKLPVSASFPGAR
jgi:hypothetical protein